MKKIIVVLSLICFVAVNYSNAQMQTSVVKETKKEAVTTNAADASATTPCSHASTKACCRKSAMKACTPQERAKCAANKTKAEADVSVKQEAKTDKN